MTAPRRKPKKLQEEELVLVNEHTTIVNFEEVRLANRGLDTFTVNKKEGQQEVIMGHEIAMAPKSEIEVGNLPIYQIIEYVEVDGAELRHTRQYNPGDTLVANEDQTILVDNEDGKHKHYVNVVKAILWPGEWSTVTRVLGT